MTIALTIPYQYDPGQGQAVEANGEIKVIEFTPYILEKRMRVVCQYGNTVNANWIASQANTVDIWVMNKAEIVHPDDPAQSIPADPQYDLMMATAKLTAAEITALAAETPVPDVYTYGLVSKGMYEWLVNENHFQGIANA